jgi:hypothetical protein
VLQRVIGRQRDVGVPTLVAHTLVGDGHLLIEQVHGSAFLAPAHVAGRAKMTPVARTRQPFHFLLQGVLDSRQPQRDERLDHRDAGTEILRQALGVPGAKRFPLAIPGYP